MRPSKTFCRTRPFVTLIAALAASSALGAPPVLPSPLRPAGLPGPVMSLSFNADAYQALKGAGPATIADFSLPDGTVVALDVSSVEVFTPGATLVVATAQGPVALERPDQVFLSGTVAGEPGSRVFLSLSPDASNGYLTRGATTYIVSSGPAGQEMAPVIYNAGELPEGAITLAAVTCGTDRLPLPPWAKIARLAGDGGPSGRAGPCREATLAIDSDWEYSGSIFGGNTGAAAAYAATLIAGVSEIYKTDINTTLKIGYLRIWATSSDPWVAGDVYNRIFEFQDYWNANMTGIQRHAAHLLSGIHSGGTGGVAYLPGLCQEDYDYGVSGYINGYFPYPLQNNHEQNWDIMVAAHELGHNFGAPHTHNMSPPVDGCGSGNCSQAAQGTIMSYCHTCSGGMTNIALTLHTRVINEKILPYLNNDAPCNIQLTAVSITDQPDNVTVNSGQPASMSVTATGSGPPSYQWYKAGSPVSGATASTISWSQATAADAGSYKVRVSNSCGTVESNAATLTVNSCPADYNGDGFVDGIDSDAFNNDFEAGNMAADYNGDGFVDGIDYDQFNNDFEAGC